MENSKVIKFESKLRLEELSPMDNLIKAGFKDGMTLCDIGAGTGVFSFPASKISSENIYALDISDSMIGILNSRIKEYNTQNIEVKKVSSDKLPLNDNTCDMTIMVTVLHEVENKEFMLSEIKRILSENGRLMIIEFHKKETPIGPPVNHRISECYVEELCSRSGFKTVSKFSLGENFYCIVFES